MRNIPLVDLKAQYLSLRREIDEAIERVIDKTAFILGEEVRAFEEEFATFCGTAHCAGVSSGTAALHLALLACGVGPAHEVITTPFTFVATAEAIFHSGAKPVFVDIDPATYNINPSNIETAITERTKAIIPVHLYGQPAEMDPILAVARENGLKVIGDAAQAHGARWKGEQIGLMGDAACFSFYPSKNLGAYGDGGAVVSNDPETVRKVRKLRNHGRESKHEHLEIGYGERLDELQAAILRVKLRRLEEWIEARRKHARLYRELLADCKVVTPHAASDARHVYHLYVIRTNRRDAVLARLRDRGIGVGVHYPTPLHLEPALARLGYRRGDLPEAEAASREVLSLPMYPELEEVQLKAVAGIISDFFQAGT
ncbi:MAG: DegT/DnrJ/EryC1/StrS family aminotransferase [Thermoplasmata archaeon]